MQQNDLRVIHREEDHHTKLTNSVHMEFGYFQITFIFNQKDLLVKTNLKLSY